MPVGLLHDPTQFPQHSAASRGYNQAHEERLQRPALTDGTVIGTFQRDMDVLAILQPESERSGEDFRLLQDLRFVSDTPLSVIEMVDSVLASGKEAVDPIEDERWAEHNPRVPVALLEPVKWMLGSTTGASLRRFTLEEVERATAAEGGDASARAALELLWGAGVIREVSS